MSQDKWLEWAVRLQALAQTGLAYGKDIYDIEDIHLLTLVLVHALDLYIKDRGRIYFHSLGLGNVALQLPLVVLLGFFQPCLQFFAVFVSQEFFQLAGIMVVAMSKQAIKVAS